MAERRAVEKHKESREPIPEELEGMNRQPSNRTFASNPPGADSDGSSDPSRSQLPTYPNSDSATALVPSPGNYNEFNNLSDSGTFSTLRHSGALRQQQWLNTLARGSVAGAVGTGNSNNPTLLSRASTVPSEALLGSMSQLPTHNHMSPQYLTRLYPQLDSMAKNRVAQMLQIQELQQIQLRQQQEMRRRILALHAQQRQQHAIEAARFPVVDAAAASTNLISRTQQHIPMSARMDLNANENSKAPGMEKLLASERISSAGRRRTTASVDIEDEKEPTSSTHPRDDKKDGRLESAEQLSHGEKSQSESSERHEQQIDLVSAKNSSFPLPRMMSQGRGNQLETTEKDYFPPKIASDLKSFRSKWESLRSRLPTNCPVHENRRTLIDMFNESLYLGRVNINPDTSISSRYTSQQNSSQKIEKTAEATQTSADSNAGNSCANDSGLGPLIAYAAAKAEANETGINKQQSLVGPQGRRSPGKRKRIQNSRAA